MKIDFPEHIKQCLKMHGSVAIPGIGSFYLKHLPASFSNNKTSLAPPNVQLSFEENQEGLGLIEFLEKLYAKETDNLRTDISKYSQKLVNKLLNLKKAEIEGLGVLRKGSDNATSFVVSKSSFFNSYFGLPTIHVQAISRQEDFLGTGNRNAVHSQTVKPSLWKYSLPLILLLLLSAGLIYFFCPCKLSSDHSVNSSTPIEVTDENNSAIYPIEVKKTECIIITGVFSKPVNILKMTSLLESKGYVVYSEVQNELTRIGFTFDCTDADLSEFIRSIRKEISKDAWYLSPQITVY